MSVAFSSDENQLIDDCNVFIQPLVRNAGEFVKEGFYKSIDAIDVKEKVAKWDLVTEYDKKVEDFLINAIKTEYPNHRWVLVGLTFEFCDFRCLFFLG